MKRILVWSGQVNDSQLFKLGDCREGELVIASHKKLFGLGKIKLWAEPVGRKQARRRRGVRQCSGCQACKPVKETPNG